MESAAENKSDDQMFEVYPNPSTENWAEVHFSPVESNGHLSVSDMNGSIVYSTTLNEGDYRKRIDVPYISGAYIVRLVTAKRTETQRWVVTL